MGLHIELSGEASPRELRALAAAVAVLLGDASVSAIVTSLVAAVPSGSPGAPAVQHVPPPPPEPDLAPPVSVVPTEPAALPPIPAPASGIVDGNPAPAPAPAGVVVDASGLPWDARIHASTKSTTKDGKWTKKRGVADELVAHVEAELKSVLAAPVPPAPPADVPPPPTDGPVHVDPAAAFGGAPIGPATSAPPSATPPGESPAPVPGPMAEFARIMRVVTAKQATGALSTEFVASLAQSLGITGVKDLATRPDLIPAFEALLP